MSSLLPRLRIVALNDVYDLRNLPRVQTFLSRLQPSASAVVCAGDFLSPSTLSSLDGGRGMVRTLRATGVTHACLGNHEADLRLATLHKRIQEFSKTAVLINSNVVTDKDPRTSWWTTELSPRYALVSTPCERVTVAFLGLLSDEAGMFRQGAFRGLKIRNVLDTFDELHETIVVQEQVADCLIPLTHETLARDRQLAQHMLKIVDSPGLIFGGHEHTKQDVVVRNNEDDYSYQDENKDCGSYVRILKSGHDAQAVSLVDVTFDFDENNRPFIADIEANLLDMKEYEPSPIVQDIVDSHLKVLQTLEHESIINADILLPPGVPLSSKGSRYRQTTVGGVLCKAMKEELEADVAILNGGTIKGNQDYPDTTMSYADLKQELPFPTKMVVVPMKRWELHECIHYSRRFPESDPEENTGTDVERRGFLQVDVEFDRLGFHTGGQDDVLQVAVPRNLLKGFCDIKPLMSIGGRLQMQGAFPADDDFVPAIDLVVRHFCKERWFEIACSQHKNFSEFDLGDKGYLDRNDVKHMLQRALQHEPADVLVDDMLSAIDADENGVIDPGEFSHLLAVMEREHGLLRFDLK